MKGNFTRVQKDFNDVVKYSGFIRDVNYFIFHDWLLKRGYNPLHTGFDEDALYIWLNPESLEKFHYCEGDLYYYLYKTKAAFDAEVIRLKNAYGAPPRHNNTIAKG